MDTSAEHIIRKCGGVQAVADLLGIDTTSVHKWKYPRARGGTDGRVPTGRQTELLRLARAAGVDLTPADFFVGSGPAPSDFPAAESAAA